eukprot:7144218-Prymnesium_polylepis.1
MSAGSVTWDRALRGDVAVRSTDSRRVAAGYVAMHMARARESCLFCGGRGALVVRTARGGG